MLRHFDIFRQWEQEGALPRLNRAAFESKFSSLFTAEELDGISEILDRLYYFDRVLFLHCWRVAVYSAVIGRRFDLDVGVLFVGGLLHDSGKIFIPSKILDKPAKLTPQEMSVVRLHPIYGTDLLTEKGIKNKTIHDMVKFHHKWFDGRGYPEGEPLQDNRIFVNIIGVCDAFDAMTSYRNYDVTKTVKEGLAELKRCSRTQFSAEVVAEFIKAEEEITQFHKLLNSVSFLKANERALSK